MFWTVVAAILLALIIWEFGGFLLYLIYGFFAFITAVIGDLFRPKQAKPIRGYTGEQTAKLEQARSSKKLKAVVLVSAVVLWLLLSSLVSNF